MEETGIVGFDLRTVIRDASGDVIKEQHYVRHVSQAYGEFFERGGKFFAPNGAPIDNPKATKVEVAATTPAAVAKAVEPAKTEEVKAEKKQEAVTFTKKA